MAEADDAYWQALTEEAAKSVGSETVLSQAVVNSYNYDTLGRLTSATGPWGSSNYKYDVLGNIMEKKVGSRTIGMTYNTINRLTSHVDLNGSGTPIASTNVNLSYDSHGNVTALGSQQFTYDMAEQPRKLLGTVAGDYTYDGNLKRVKAVVAGKTIYNVYDASGTLVHVDESTDGRSTDYIGKIVRIKTASGTSTPTWLHMDHLGSAQTGSSATGAIAWREHPKSTSSLSLRAKYTPYGTTLINPASNNDQAGFTGHIKDSATGLTYMQARYYDPLIGRFLSIDPVGFSVGQPQMFNRYSYVNNDPVNKIDPFGKQAADPEKNNAATSGATGTGAYVAQNGARSAQVRSQYQSDVSKLNPSDSAGRSALKQSSRAATPAPQRAIINAARPSTGAQAGTSGTATHSNAKVNAGAKALGVVGKASGVVVVATGTYQIATSDNKPRTASGVAGAAGGGVAGGILGAEAGAAIGVWFGGAGAVPGAIIGGIIGSVAGGVGGDAAGTAIYDEVTGQ